MKTRVLTLSLVCCAVITACTGTDTRSGSLTGILTPGWQRLGDSARHAAMDPNTWVPLAGAALFGIDDFDRQTVNWATRHTPVFGDVEDAKDASDTLRDLTRVNYLVSALAVPTGSGSGDYSRKARGLLLGVAAIGVNDGVTNVIKDVTDRKRPDRDIRDYDDNSFPSLHMSGAAIAARLASRNIDAMNLTPAQKRLWTVGSFTAAGLTGWARIEGGRHYPSDVLAGYALGNFLGAFLNDAFISPTFGSNVQISTVISHSEGSWLTLSYRW